MPHQQPGRFRGHRPAQPPASGSVVIIGGVVLAVLAMVLVIFIQRGPTAADPGAPQAWIVPPVSGPAPLIPLQSDPVPTAPSVSPSRPPTAAATGKPLPVARPSSSAPTRRPVRLLPAPGSRLSLVVVGGPGLRLRHQNFRLRLAAVGPGSSALDRADATFVLRPGLADPRCLSLESVNFPGRFVRHHDFVLVLQSRESSPAFSTDATFCPRAAGTGGDFVLRPTNFPDRHVVVDGSAVVLGERTAAPALRFHAAAGL
jgi:hypothetical protein